MYSRYHDRPDRPIRLPENYSGCAFSPREERKEEGEGEERITPRRVEIGRPTPLPPRSVEDAPPPFARDEIPTEMPSKLPVLTGTDDGEEDEDATNPAASPAGGFLKPFGGLFGNVGRAFPFSHGIGFDEILILGLILLLSRDEQGSDLVLWLALLLFCG